MSFWYANPRMAETCEVWAAVSESDTSHDVFFLITTKVPKACAYHEGCGAGVKWSLRIASRDCFSQSDNWKEWQFRFDLITFGAGTDRGHDDRDCKFRAPETSEVCRTVHPVERARLGSLVVGGNAGSRAVVFPIPRVGLLEERPAVSGRREKTQREELQCQVEDDTAEGLVVKTMKVLLVTSLGQCDGRLTAGLCTFRVTDRGKGVAMISSSRDHEHLEVILDGACVMAEDRESWMCRFSNSRWVIARDKECEDAQRCVNVDKLVNETITCNVKP